MMFTDVVGQKVVATDTAVTVGKVADVVVDARTRTVVGLTLAKTQGEGTALPWANLKAIGTDAVTVASADAIVVPDEELARLSDKKHAMLGKRVLSTAGVEIGKLKDVDFDPSDGRVIGLILDTQAVDASYLLGCGSWAVVLRSADMPPTDAAASPAAAEPTSSG